MGRGLSGEEEGKWRGREGGGSRGEGKGGPKLLLNQGSSENCYTTECTTFIHKELLCEFRSVQTGYRPLCTVKTKF